MGFPTSTCLFQGWKPSGLSWPPQRQQALSTIPPTSSWKAATCGAGQCPFLSWHLGACWAVPLLINTRLPFCQFSAFVWVPPFLCPFWLTLSLLFFLPLCVSPFGIFHPVSTFVFFTLCHLLSLTHLLLCLSLWTDLGMSCSSRVIYLGQEWCPEWWEDTTVHPNQFCILFLPVSIKSNLQMIDTPTHTHLIPS